MKIIIIQAAGEHDGSTHLDKNNHMRECLSLQYAFQQNGWDADVWGKRFENFNNPPNFDKYDYLLNLENYEMEWLPDFKKITKPIKMQWIIDLHCQRPEIYARISRNMDIILHATKSLMPFYRQHFPHLPHVWFPPAIDERYFKNYNKEKTKDIIFVGNVINRGNYIQQLNKIVGLEYYMKTGQVMLDLISSSKVHFNKTMSPHGTNYRNLETIALGTCLLADNKPEVCELGFKNGINCLLYNNIDDCLKKYKYAMMNDNWKKIGEEGLKLAKEHTYTKRISNLLNDIGNMAPSDSERYNLILTNLKKNHVYFIGDSHSTIHYEAVNLCNNTLVYKFHGSVERPPLMYSFGKYKIDKINLKEISKTEINLNSYAYSNKESKYRPIEENDYVIFSMGEVDCRAHIGNHIKNDKDYINMIDKMVENYMEAILQNKKLYNNNLNIMVACVSPPVRNKNFPKSLNWPIVSSDENRKIWTNYINKKLKEYCIKYNYHFIDIYDFFTDKNNGDNKDYLDIEKSDGANHINHKNKYNLDIITKYYSNLYFK